MKLGVTSLVIATAAVMIVPKAAAQEVPVVHEGAYWVGRIAGSFPMTAQARLQVKTRGSVTVKRGSSDQVTYSVRQRVRATSEERARVLLGGGGARLRPLPGRALLEIQPNSDPNVLIDIEVSVPPQLSMVTIQTEVGGVDIGEFDGAVQVSTGGGQIQLGKIGGSV